MIMFAEKVRRVVSTKFAFVVMTDRDDLDGQIYRSFVGCGVADENTPRASSGKELERVWSAIASSHFYPAPSALNCGSCPFRDPCRVWDG